MKIEAIKKVIKSAEIDLDMCIIKRNDLRNRISFCYQHKFHEEERIARLQLQPMENVIYEYQTL